MPIEEFNEAMKRVHYWDIAERYEDMAEELKLVIKLARENKMELNAQVRNSFSLAFKNLVSVRRNSWRVLNSEQQKFQNLQHPNGQNSLHEYSPEDLHIADEFIQKIETELLTYCDMVLQIIDDDILPGAKKVDDLVFFLKMKGDYFRYKSEVQSGTIQSETSAKALKNYEEAKEKANSLSSTNPIRLGLYLNYSVFYYEILNDTEKACKIARTAFDTAISELDLLNEDYYKDSTLIMQLLRDNLTLWTSRSDATRSGDEKQSE